MLCKTPFWIGFAKRLLRTATCGILITMAAFSPVRTEAGTHTWTGGGANEFWNNAANWSGGAPTAGEAAPVILIFPGGVTTTNNITGLTVDTLQFNGSGTVLHGNGIATLTFRGAGGTNLFVDTFLFASNAIASTLPVTMSGSNYFYLEPIYHSLAISSVISGSGVVMFGGNGRFHYGGTQPNTATGKIWVNSCGLHLEKSAGVNAIAGPIEVMGVNSTGSLVVQNANQIPDATAITVAQVGRLDLAANETLGNLTLTGGQVYGNGGVLILSGNVASLGTNNSRIAAPVSLGGATRTFNVASAILTISEVVSNGAAVAGITKTGAGRLSLEGTNTFTGSTTVSAGTLEALNDSAFGTTAGGVTVSGGTLVLNNVDIGAEALSLTGSLTTTGTNSWAGTVTLPTETTITTPGYSQLTISGVISGGGSISKSGSGTLVFSGTGANTFAGGISITDGLLSLNKTGVNAIVGGISIGPVSGTIRLQQTGQIADTQPVAVYAGGTLDLNNNSETIGSLEGGGAVNLLFATLTTGGNNNSTVFSGGIGGIGGIPIVKNGTGTFTLTGTNNCLGTTTVNAGKLVVAGELTSHISVAAGATLSGSGKVANVTTTSGHLQPGGAPGKIFTGNLNLNNPAGAVTFEINGSTPGSGHDQIAVNGTVTLGTPTLTLVVGTGGGMSNQYVLIDNNGTDPVSGTFNGLPEGATINAGLVSYKISYVGGTGNDVVLTQTATPPPPTITRMQKQAGGTMLINASGLPGTGYLVDATTNLTTLNWSTIGFVISAGDGRFSYTDEDAPGQPMRFYRLRMQ